jgi:death-on-curing protein
VRYLTLGEVVELHFRVTAATGGAVQLRDLGLLESAVAQPRMSYAGEDLYQTLDEKAAALGFSLIRNHPFLDGNKRVGHAAVETFLMLNGFELQAPVADAERAILGVADGSLDRAAFVSWIGAHRVPMKS